MPALDIIVCHGCGSFHIHQSHHWLCAREHCALGPLMVDVTKPDDGGAGTLADFMVEQEQQGHQFPDVPVDAIVACMSCLKAKLLNL